MNPTTESPVRPPIVPSTPALPVREAPPPSYPPELLANAPQVPAIPFRKSADPGDVWLTLEKAHDIFRKLALQETELNAKLTSAKAAEERLTNDEREDEESLVAELSVAQARTRVLQSRLQKTSQKRQAAAEELRTRLDCAKTLLQQQAETLRAQRVIAVVEWLKERIDPAAGLADVAKYAFGVQALNKFCPPELVRHLGVSPTSELRPAAMEKEIAALLQKREAFEAEAKKTSP